MALAFAAQANAGERLAPTVDTLVADFMAARTPGTSVVIPGMSVSIGRDGILIHAAGYGLANADRPAAASTIYAIGSITKQMTAASVLRLIEEGAVTNSTGLPLETSLPVEQVLDIAHAWANDDMPPITIGNLLAMTSSLPNFTRRPPPQLNPWGAVPARLLLGTMKDYRPHERPGSFEYSNTNYFLLAELMEEVNVRGRRRNYHQIMRDEIFLRLNLPDTGFATDRDITRRIAQPHYHRHLTFAHPDWLKGCADVASSVLGLFEWNKAILEGRVLGPAMRAVMFADAARVDPWTYYGAGWFISHKDGLERYFHSGTVAGYTAFNLIVIPSPGHWVSVSLLANSDGATGIDELANAISSVAIGNE